MVIWHSDDDDDDAELLPSLASRNPDAPGPSTLVVPQVCLSDSSDNDNFESNWDDDDDAELLPSPASRNPNTPGPSTLAVPQVWLSDSSDNEKFESDWDDDDDAALLPFPASRNPDAPGPSTLAVRQDRANGAVPSGYSVQHYVAMGFRKDLVLKAIKKVGETSGNGDGDPSSLLDVLLTEKGLDDGSESWDDEDDEFERHAFSNYSDAEDFVQEKMSQRDKKMQCLVGMGFPKDEAELAIRRCGQECAISILVDSIYASQTEGDEHEVMDDNCIDSSLARKKPRIMEDRQKRRKQYGFGAQTNPLLLDCSHEYPVLLPNPMLGFNLPSNPSCSMSRSIPIDATGPPYFYFENVARAPIGVWDTISTALYGIRPEFVDSKLFSAAMRKGGYLHNLPVENRSYLCPIPPNSIFEAFPHYKIWWPSWDRRIQFNCLRTRVASADLLECIRRRLEGQGNPPAESIQKIVLEDCRNWNLVWIGKNRVAPLEPDEMEFLLGFPMDHTRGACKTKRYKSLGAPTICNNLSVLKKIFHDGINVISLFSGIGGAEVALHRLGIHMKAVVSVESSEDNRRILKSWWNETQKGKLIEFEKVQSLTDAKISSLVKEHGGFDLVIGGSPCNNFTGSNRHHRNGLDGEHSALFYDYARIVHSLRSIMKAR